MTKADVVVIGGGSTGASVAYYLSLRGAGRVVLIEKDYTAWGQTGRSTAVVRLHYSTPQVCRMALISYQVLKDMEKVVGGPSGFTACGFALAVGDKDESAIRRNVEMQRSLGIDTKLITPKELKEIQPQIDTTGLAAAAYEPNSGYADPTITAQSYSEAAVRNGCLLMTKTRVNGFNIMERRIVSAVTDRGTVEAEVFVNAAGVWANDLLSYLGISVPIDVVKEEIVVWRRPNDFTGPHLVFADLPHNYYIRPFGDTQTYMGSLNPDLSRREKSPEKFRLDEKPSMETFLTYGEALSKRFPVMEKAEAAGGWVGLYDVTPDWHPIIGRSRSVENLFNIVGLSGHGFKLCPAYGMLMSDLILKGKSDIVEPSFFAETRFQEGRLIGAAYEYGVIS